jgi:hypothetical protein
VRVWGEGWVGVRKEGGKNKAKGKIKGQHQHQCQCQRQRQHQRQCPNKGKTTGTVR